MSKRVASKGNAQESFLSKEYVRIPRYKEIQCCRVKTHMYVLEILKLYEKKYGIVQNYLVFPKQHVVTRKALVLRVCLSV